MPPAAPLRPGEECHDAARRPLGVAKVEVIGAGIVEVDGQLHEPKAEDLRVEVEIALRVAGDRRDVMKTEDLAHERIITPDVRASNALGYGFRRSRRLRVNQPGERGDE